MNARCAKLRLGEVAASGTCSCRRTPGWDSLACDGTMAVIRKIQIGANPVLPALRQYLIPPIRIAKVVAWGKETPTLPQGLQVHALATGFEHPRFPLRSSPMETCWWWRAMVRRRRSAGPRTSSTGWVQWFAGAKAKDANRITAAARR